MPLVKGSSYCAKHFMRQKLNSEIIPTQQQSMVAAALYYESFILLAGTRNHLCPGEIIRRVNYRTIKDRSLLEAAKDLGWGQKFNFQQLKQPWAQTWTLMFTNTVHPVWQLKSILLLKYWQIRFIQLTFNLLIVGLLHKITIRHIAACYCNAWKDCK